MAYAFSKGDVVYLIARWDDSATFYVRKCEVVSCGAQQMHLIDAGTRATVGANFLPTDEQGNFSMVVRMGEEAAFHLAAMLAKDWKNVELATIERKMQNAGPQARGYASALAMLRDALANAQPRVAKYGRLVEELYQRTYGRSIKKAHELD